LALLLPYTLGVGLVLAATFLAFWLQGTLDELLWISLALPFLSLEQAAETAPLGRLVRSLNWYAACLGPWLVFAILPLSRVFRRDEPALTRQMFAWIVLGGFSILMQMNSFWHYHFTLVVRAELLPPGHRSAAASVVLQSDGQAAEADGAFAIPGAAGNGCHRFSVRRSGTEFLPDGVQR
jgi:hypothetical protein